MGEVAETGAAEALGNRDPEQALLAQLRPQVAWKDVAAVDFSGTRGDFRGREAPYLVANLLQVGS